MQALTKEEKKANLEAYEKSLAKPQKDEPTVEVRVVVPPGFWYGASPRMMKLYAEGETLVVPEHVWKNSDFHNIRKGVNGQTVRGVLELASIQENAPRDLIGEDIKALQERNQELERKLAALTGSTPPMPLVVPDEGGKKNAKSKKEEI